MQKILTPILILLWIALIAFYGTQFYVLSFGENLQRQLTLSQPKHPVIQNVKIDTSQIDRWHLFGRQATAQQPQRKPALALAKPSTRSYRIAGMAQANRENLSSVLFETKPGDMAFFLVGDTVEKGVTVKGIQNGSVLLEVNGRLERIDPPVAKEKLFIPVNRSKYQVLNNQVDWSWLQEWPRLSNQVVFEKLGLQYSDNRWIIDRRSPLLVSKKLRAGYSVISVNGKTLNDENVKAVFQPLMLGDSFYILVQTDRKRMSVRWNNL